MKKLIRYSLFISYIIGALLIIYFLGFIIFQPSWSEILFDWSFYPTIFFFIISIQELYHWAKIGKRSELSDIIAIAFFFFFIFFFTKDLLTSIMGAFSIYLWFGVFELKDYPIINKILIISLVTYNIIFIAGIVSAFMNNPFFINTAFAFSFWIILILGFLLFGRKYIVVWRFMSPAYLTLFLYIIGWLAVIFINQYTLIDLNIHTPLGPLEINLIYPVLIGVNWLVYFISGPILDKLLGIKRVNDDEILELVEDVKNDIGISGNVKVGFGIYPILNAMAYGSFFDKRIAIIAESKDQIPKDELRGIVAHELAHTKGKHTLILTFIATMDLVIRMILGFPATYYDYTFGDPEIPMIYFILINLLIFMVIFVIVRYLEARADLNAKKAGYSKELAKALYNLESFYATGREFGLNTMLLCDEKITEDNQFLDYNETARYLYSSMIQPSRGSLLANIMNSHPPSYFRIAAILDDQLKPIKEAILPFICLSRKKQIKYAKKFQNARKAFKLVANEKIKEKFELEDLSSVFQELNRKELYKLDLDKDFMFRNKITSELILGKLKDIRFLDDACNSDQYIIINLKTNQKMTLDASYYTKNEVKMDGTYYFENNTPLKLKKIDLDEKNTDGNYIFKNEKKEILKSIKKTKLPNSITFIKNLEGQDLFLKLKGHLKIFRCNQVDVSDNIDDYRMELENVMTNENLNLKLKDLIIRPNKIYLPITKNLEYRKSEIYVINWLIKNKIFTQVYIKKPVNNLEMGYVQEIHLNGSSGQDNSLENEIDEVENIIIKNIFGKKITIPYSSLEVIMFESNTAMIQLKSETSMFSRLGYKMLKKIKPKSIFYANKV
ncbi:MAG: hypothetical protein EU539_12850 [Promethearchaeota archaeon]|nr:MAG: hypothetical protein EU539_12850 [Candidatus Lokiarchaeota archaeon]